MKYVVTCILLFVMFMSTSAIAGNGSTIPAHWKTRNGWKNPNWKPPEGYNTTLSSQGYGVKVHKFIEVRNGRPFTVYKYTLDMPCFYTAPKNTPCDRGTFHRKNHGKKSKNPAGWSTIRFIDE